MTAYLQDKPRFGFARRIVQADRTLQPVAAIGGQIRSRSVHDYGADPMSVHWPEMIDGQEKNTVFLKPLITSPKIEVGEFTYYNDTDDPTGFETQNVLYTAGPEKLIIGKQRYSDEDIDRLLRLAWWNWPIDVITEHVRTIWTGTPAEPEQAARGRRPAGS